MRNHPTRRFEWHPTDMVLEDSPKPVKYSEDQERDDADLFVPSKPAKARGTGWKARYWKRVDTRARSHEGRVLGAAAEAFNADMRELLVLLGEAEKAALRTKASVDWQGLLLKAEDYLALGGPAGTNWREVFTPVLTAIMTDAGEDFLLEFGMQFAVPNVGALGWFQDYTLKFAQPINETTLGSVSTLLQQAQDEGWSIGQMQSHLQEVFAQWAGGGATGEDFDWYSERMPAYRAEAIARTETIRASNAGTFNLATEWGLETKAWLATQDDRTRDDHLEADGQQVLMDEPFDVGGEELMYPGDPAGSPGNTINCRCTWIPIIPGLTGGPETPEDLLGEEEPPEEAALRPGGRTKYSEDQERDELGRFAGGGGGNDGPTLTINVEKMEQAEFGDKLNGDTKTETSANVKAFAEKYGVDPADIRVVDKLPASIARDLGSSSKDTVAVFSTDTGKITIVNVPEGVREGVVIHEIEHLKFDAVFDDPKVAAYIDKNEKDLAREDGTTQFARMFWDAGMTETAMHESLAELARLGLVRGETPASKETWGELMQLVDRRYAATDKSRKARKTTGALTEVARVYFDGNFEPATDPALAVMAKVVYSDQSRAFLLVNTTGGKYSEDQERDEWVSSQRKARDGRGPFGVLGI